MLKAIFELFLLYLLYKLIFDFIIPVYQTTKQVSKKMGEMQSKMNDHFSQQSAGSGGQSQANATVEKPTREDYIDFEEVK